MTTPAATNRPHKVAVIDDDPDALRTAERVLNLAGFEVVTYGAAHSRLPFLLRETPDVVLLDVNMPLVSGDEICRIMRENPLLAHIPVVFFSSNDETTLRTMVSESGAAGYITKSEIGLDLGRRLKRILGRTRVSA